MTHFFRWNIFVKNTINESNCFQIVKLPHRTPSCHPDMLIHNNYLSLWHFVFLYNFCRLWNAKLFCSLALNQQVQLQFFASRSMWNFYMNFYYALNHRNLKLWAQIQIITKAPIFLAKKSRIIKFIRYILRFVEIVCLKEEY